MAAISIAMSRGKDGFAISDFTFGTSAPGTGDFEVRYNTTDGQSKAMLRLDIVKMLEAVERLIEQNGLQSPAGTFVVTAPPL